MLRMNFPRRREQRRDEAQHRGFLRRCVLEGKHLDDPEVIEFKAGMDARAAKYPGCN